MGYYKCSYIQNDYKEYGVQANNGALFNNYVRIATINSSIRETFDEPIVIGDQLYQCNLYGCKYLNSPVSLGNGLINCDRMFQQCENFNQPIIIPNNVISCNHMFAHCFSFNQPIIIPNNVIHCQNMFQNCRNLQSHIIIGENANDLYYMFDNCRLANFSVTFLGENPRDCQRMFMNCTGLNTPITIPKGTYNCWGTFYYCYNYGQEVIIPSTVNHCGYMFYGVTSNNLTVKYCPPEVVNVENMFYLFNYYNTTIYTNNASRFLSRIWGQISPTWETITNGYYNSTYNIHIYNDYIEP